MRGATASAAQVPRTKRRSEAVRPSPRSPSTRQGLRRCQGGRTSAGDPQQPPPTNLQPRCGFFAVARRQTLLEQLRYELRASNTRRSLQQDAELIRKCRCRGHRGRRGIFSPARLPHSSHSPHSWLHCVCLHVLTCTQNYFGRGCGSSSARSGAASHGPSCRSAS